MTHRPITRNDLLAMVERLENDFGMEFTDTKEAIVSGTLHDLAGVSEPVEKPGLLKKIREFFTKVLPNETKNQGVSTECTHPTKNPPPPEIEDPINFMKKPC